MQSEENGIGCYRWFWFYSFSCHGLTSEVSISTRVFQWSNLTSESNPKSKYFITFLEIFRCDGFSWRNVLRRMEEKNILIRSFYNLSEQVTSTAVESSQRRVGYFSLKAESTLSALQTEVGQTLTANSATVLSPGKSPFIRRRVFLAEQWKLVETVRLLLYFIRIFMRWAKVAKQDRDNDISWSR